MKSKVLIWDAPVRVFHWLLALSFLGAYLTAESERWQLVHITLGYTVGGLVVFRLLWGVVGTRYARFGSFVRGPRAVAGYLQALLARRPEHHLGHNPAGALAIVMLLGLSLLSVTTGWLIYNDIGSPTLASVLEELHEGAANFMLATVVVHVAGVLLSSWLHGENLVRAMVTGRKEGEPGQGLRWSWWPLALLLLLAVLAFWWLQAKSGPMAG